MKNRFIPALLGVSNDTESFGKRRGSFTGHFADSVELMFADRPDISTQQIRRR
ncbi:MAG: hypothetical protein ACKVHO_04040 [Verrucomicrobiia bacterium]|jgi:hypothetical protein